MTEDCNVSENEAGEKGKKLFYTTSDMMTTINKSIASLDCPDDAISPRVELQRRMPDGTTRRADDKDLEAADMDSKFKQAAEQVADLDPKQKIEWAEKQRQEGNILYKEGDYRAALDVYLTCLVAKTDDESFVPLVFLPVMNNLAQSSLQLGMYRKAEQFCTLALEEIQGEETSSSSSQLVAKLYFRRGKAKRLSAEYSAARDDLEMALNTLEKESTEYKSVQRELQLVQRAEMEERQNEKRQERAMQRLLGSNADAATANSHTGGNKHEDSNVGVKESSSGLYRGEENKRTYSTLTARRREDEAGRAGPKQSCWRWYLSMVARVAEKLLILLGDEEYTDRHGDGVDSSDRRKKD